MLPPKTHLYERTPIRHLPALNQALGKEIYFKMDCYQPSRSFKLRGMDLLVREKTAVGVDRFISSSGGNAGYSLAYCTMRYGAYLKVFVPTTTPSFMVERIRGEGAVVEVVGASWDEAHAAAAEEAIRTHSYYVSPFDDPLLWKGHSSLIQECSEEMQEPDLVVLAVGGGGLLCGVMEGLEHVKWKKAKVLAMETEGAASYSAAVNAGHVVDFGAIHSVARSLGARKVSQKAVEWASLGRIINGTTSDEKALLACRLFADAFQVLVEPACGAALEPALVSHSRLEGCDKVLVVVCGGAGVQLSDLGAAIS